MFNLPPISRSNSNSISNNILISILLSFTLSGTSQFAVAQTIKASSNTVKNSQFLSVEYMTGVSDMHGFRLAYRPATSRVIDIPWVGATTLSWEASLNLYDLHGSAKNEATYGVSISPILAKEIGQWAQSYPVSVEFGIGLAYVHREKFGGVDIGSYYQFEDRLGLIFSLDAEQKSELALRYIHYSNGGLNTKNPGLDFLSFGYFRRF